MRIVTKKELSIFLASSAELRDDRIQFGDFVMQLQEHYSNRNIGFQLKKWEYFDKTFAFDGDRTQDAYNYQVSICDVFICLFYTKSGEFTIEEFEVALEQNRKRKLPLFIYMRQLDSFKQEDESLTKFKEQLKKLRYFWGSYDSNAKLHLDFVLWLDSYLFDSRSAITVDNEVVKLGNVKIATMSQLPFAANNESYQRLSYDLSELRAKIAAFRKELEQNPSSEFLQKELQSNLDRYNQLKQDYENLQQDLISTEKSIIEFQKRQVNDRLKRAMEYFESGDLNGAKAILRENALEAVGHVERLDRDRDLVHQDIDSLLFQANIEMAVIDTPIDERIKIVTKIYVQADDLAERSAYDKKRYAKLLLDYAQFHYQYGPYSKAVEIYLRQINLSENVYGMAHLDTARSYNNLGTVYYNNGEYDKALEYLDKALKINERNLGKYHSDTAITYNSIGGVYYKKCNFDLAINYLNTAIDILERVTVVDNPTTALFYCNIGAVYYEKGEYQKALDYMEKALKIRKKVLNSDHPDIASSYNNIGEVYKSKQEFGKALEYHSNALKIREKALGYHHPDTAISYNNIGSIYLSKGDFNLALAFYSKAIEINETTLGLDNPNTATSYNDIGIVYQRLREYDKAVEFSKKALAIYIDRLGLNHPFTATTYMNIANINFEKGEYQKSLEYYEKALSLYEKLGTDHHNTKMIQNTINNIHVILNNANNRSDNIVYNQGV